MTTKIVPGVLIATPNAEQVAFEAATRMGKTIRDAIDARGSASVALSGGTTPRAAYERLGREPIDWSKVNLFWVDERAVPAGDARSNYRLVKETLLDPAKVEASRVHRMAADAPDLDAAARDYERTIRKHVKPDGGDVPAFDLLVLGIGDDGHTASLFPFQPAVEVTDRLVVGVPEAPGREARLTITVPVIEAARAAIVIAVGKAKNAPLERAWLVSGTFSDTPARVIRNMRGAITWVIDRAAGGIGD
jgi:6-phosphogluconolactonase